MRVVIESPAERETDFKGLPDGDNQHQKADEDMHPMPELPVALEVALGGEE